METPCLCPSEGHKDGGRKVKETSVTEFCGLTAEYPATRTNFLVAGYAVRRNLLIQVEVVCNSEFKMAFS